MTQRALSGRTATFLVVASMVGTGVFSTSGFLLADLHSAPAVLLAWAIGGVLAGAGALSYAELVAALPENGGEYHLLSEIYHPAIGFMAGVVSFVVGFAAPIAASALAFGDYLHSAWPAVDAKLAALALIASMSLVHAGQVRHGGWVQDALTAFKIALIVVTLVVGLMFGDLSRLSEGTASVTEGLLSSEMAVALVFVTFSYSGWNAAAYIAGEVRDPGRTLPRALLVGTAVVTLLYVLVNAAFLAAAPASALAGDVTVGHTAAASLFGPTAGSALSAVIAFGLLSTVGALIMTGTRVVAAMGRDHGRLALLARRATGKSPRLAVGLQGGVAAIMVLTAKLETLLGYIGMTLSIFAGLTVLGVIVLRRRRPDLPRPVRTWGYPVTPMVFVASTVWMIVWSVSAEPKAAWAGAATIGLSGLLYLLVKEQKAPSP
ncbi:MAG: APC family permease [Sandaracinaceae bacterium]